MKKAALQPKVKVIAYALLGIAAILLVYAAFVMTSAQKAYEYIAAGDFSAASSLLEQLPSISKKISDAKTLSQAMELMDAGEYEQAEQMCASATSFDTEEILRKAYYLCARQAEDEGNDLAALKLYLSVGGYMDSLERVEELNKNVYAQAVEFFNSGDDQTAYEYFMEVLDYKDTKQYIQTIDADTYDELIAMADFAGARVKLARYEYIRQFLVGYWSGGGGAISVQEKNGSVLFGLKLNVNVSGMQMTIEDGRLVLPNDTFAIEITGANSITVTHEQSGRIYYMKRK